MCAPNVARSNTKLNINGLVHPCPTNDQFGAQ
ncbi:hypothetical protein PUN4_280007 [Paraburkholderia unamae]|nr:hypothetical protein PUN4_280007 [Paraburkholderia unamae]